MNDSRAEVVDMICYSEDMFTVGWVTGLGFGLLYSDVNEWVINCMDLEVEDIANV